MIAAKVASDYLPPFLLSVVRFLIVAMCILPFTRTIQTPFRKVFLLAQIWGTFYFAFFFTSFNLGITAGAAAIAIQMTLPFTVLLGVFLTKERTTILKILGILIAFIGVYIMKEAPDLTGHALALMLMVISAFVLALATVLLKQNDEENVAALTGWMSVFSIPVLLVIALLSPYMPFLVDELAFTTEHFQLTWEFTAAVLFMGIAANVYVGITWLFLLRHNPASSVMAFTLLVPVFGVILAYFVLDEVITLPILVGGGMVIAGMSVILYKKR